MPVVLEQIDPSKCPYRLHGQNISYLSRGKLRVIAKDLAVSPEGVKLKLFNRIIAHLEQSGAKAEISEAAEAETQ